MSLTSRSWMTNVTSGLTYVLVGYTLGGMCRRMNCQTCGKPTWAGCGAHVEEVLGDVPKAERCQCNETGSTGSTNKSFLRTLLGR